MTAIVLLPLFAVLFGISSAEILYSQELPASNKSIGCGYFNEWISAVTSNPTTILVADDFEVQSDPSKIEEDYFWNVTAVQLIGFYMNDTESVPFIYNFTALIFSSFHNTSTNVEYPGDILCKDTGVPVGGFGAISPVLNFTSGCLLPRGRYYFSLFPELHSFGFNGFWATLRNTTDFSIVQGTTMRILDTGMETLQTPRGQWTTAEYMGVLATAEIQFNIFGREVYPNEITPTSTSITDASSVGSSSGRSNSDTRLIAGVVGGGVALILLMVLGVLVLLLIKRRRNESHDPEEDVDLAHLHAIEGVRLDAIVGSGQFGTVYRGFYRGKEVAVKEMKWSDEKAVAEFQQEAAINALITPHPNVVQFLGVMVKPDTVLLVSEYHGGGSLENTIKGRSVPVSLQIQWATEIARGMHHLHTAIEGRQLIHRDLAARNILLNTQGVAAICDFGMARIQMENDIYGRTQNSFGPLKWMAPEAIQFGKYSTKSDVFSYGCVLYEIATGGLPWATSTNTVAAQLVIQGERLPIPEGCEKKIAQIMFSCWAALPDHRPDFATILDALPPPM